MKQLPARFIALAVAVTLSVAQLAAQAAQTAARPLEMADILAWKGIRSSALSNDGAWFAYQLAPNEGDAEVVIRSTTGTTEYRFPIGEPPRGFPGPGGASARVAFSGTSRWVAFATYPTAAEARKLRKDKKTPQNGAKLVNLANGTAVPFDKINRFAFSGERGDWIALHRYAAEAAGSEPKTQGADLLLHEVATGQQISLGNVSEFAFDRAGERLAWLVDAKDQVGNALMLRDMRTGVITALDNDKVLYRSLAWADSGKGVAALKGREEKAASDTAYSVIAFTDLGARAPTRFAYQPFDDAAFPARTILSGRRSLTWSDDAAVVYVGIRPPRNAEWTGPKRDSAQAAEPQKDADEPEIPDLWLWHFKDPRLQSQQSVEKTRDENFTYLSAFLLRENRFVRLADDSVWTVNPIRAPRARWALGSDHQSYELQGNLDGQRYSDAYVIDVRTGARRLAMPRLRFGNPTPSPDGMRILYYEDGHYHVYHIETGEKRSITANVPASFINTEDDHNVVKPPRPALGWSSDGAWVLISDGWDLWRVPTGSGQAVNLTVNGRKEQIRYRNRVLPAPEERGFDPAKPLHVTAYSERTKKNGIGRIEPRQPGVKLLFWDDAYFTVTKARNAEVYVYTRETQQEFPNYYVTNASLAPGQRITDANPQQKDFGWSSGVRLVDYSCTKGDSFRASLVLPANYQPGQKYPTIVWIYEKRSQEAFRYPFPSVSGAMNTAVYASRGYAVLLPDIAYHLNDPGMSSVWCVVPALDAAIATGIVDPARVGLHGHSWGGYQTSFLITQTDKFAAAVAGAPLTNLISMYGEIYWNTGSVNGSIFEASQGRFTGGPWELLEDYVRNSPVFFAPKVKTPLLLLHNDKDGAVDFNQGIEYFNTLRRLGKPVVMLEYRGENHGLAKPENQKDYATRMAEFFDHYLRGKPAPDWLIKGVPLLEMERHLKTRAKPVTAVTSDAR